MQFVQYWGPLGGLEERHGSYFHTIVELLAGIDHQTAGLFELNQRMADRIGTWRLHLAHPLVCFAFGLTSGTVSSAHLRVILHAMGWPTLYRALATFERPWSPTSSRKIQLKCAALEMIDEIEEDRLHAVPPHNEEAAWMDHIRKHFSHVLIDVCFNIVGGSDVVIDNVKVEKLALLASLGVHPYDYPVWLLRTIIHPATSPSSLDREDRTRLEDAASPVVA